MEDWISFDNHPVRDPGTRNWRIYHCSASDSPKWNNTGLERAICLSFWWAYTEKLFSFITFVCKVDFSWIKQANKRCPNNKPNRWGWGFFPPGFFFTHSKVQKKPSGRGKERFARVCVAFMYSFAIFAYMFKWDSKEKRTN